MSSMTHEDSIPSIGEMKYELSMNLLFKENHFLPKKKTKFLVFLLFLMNLFDNINLNLIFPALCYN